MLNILYPLVGSLVGVIIGAGLTYWANLVIQNRKINNEMLKYYNSNELVFSRTVLWKFKEDILKKNGLKDLYDESNAFDLLNNPNHLLFHLERVNYFWYMLHVENFDKNYLRKYYGRHYTAWYSEFYIHFDKHLLEIKTDNTGWRASAVERKSLAKKMGII